MRLSRAYLILISVSGVKRRVRLEVRVRVRVRVRQEIRLEVRREETLLLVLLRPRTLRRGQGRGRG